MEYEILNSEVLNTFCILFGFLGICIGLWLSIVLHFVLNKFYDFIKKYIK